MRTRNRVFEFAQLFTSVYDPVVTQGKCVLFLLRNTTGKKGGLPV